MLKRTNFNNLKKLTIVITATVIAISSIRSFSRPYKSKVQAYEACQNWIKNGGTYKLITREKEQNENKFFFGDFKWKDWTDEELKDRHSKRFKKGSLFEEFTKNDLLLLRSERELIEYEELVTYPSREINLIRRYCSHEPETQQYLGYQTVNRSKNSIFKNKLFCKHEASKEVPLGADCLIDKEAVNKITKHFHY